MQLLKLCEPFICFIHVDLHRTRTTRNVYPNINWQPLSLPDISREHWPQYSRWEPSADTCHSPVCQSVPTNLARQPVHADGSSGLCSFVVGCSGITRSYHWTRVSHRPSCCSLEILLLVYVAILGNYLHIKRVSIV